MTKHATLMALGLTALAVGCGGGTRDDAPTSPSTQLQAAPSRERPSEQELAAARTSAPVTAVPVKYVVDPGSEAQLRSAAGTEAARPDASPGLKTEGGARRPIP
ncbi:hypothetical protein D7V97_03105 [Corallococcus sp. CA053C]|uniref:hypothetical protein n=1 Tax=Corallococcus sp. CA053C TaxID=2316732 RepID=UPI000EA3B162|nr:hypothetical protein [Corallococcus sp. CA053C]RKH14421.1 hypothetical protein D7V97_03105 [Corallococcus sp. CA053C]